jgi:hypothetical protein
VGWSQRLGINARSDEVLAERWSGRPCWVFHLEQVREARAMTLGIGLRAARERLQARSGSVVDGVVYGLYVRMAGDLFAPSIPPSGPGPSPP